MSGRTICGVVVFRDKDGCEYVEDTTAFPSASESR